MLDPIIQILIVIFIPIFWFLILFILKWRLKFETRSVMFRVALLSSVSSTILIILCITGVGLFGDNIVFIVTAVPIGFTASLYMYYYTIKIIQEQVKTINKKTDELMYVFNTSSTTAVNVSNNSTELAASASEVNASAEQISSTTQDVAERSKNQAQSLNKINRMAEDVRAITKIIKEISEQTNLLALNASIEAGRAGSSGLGFGVVADKVQKLAEESKNSVEKTSVIVKAITEHIKSAALDSQEISIAMAEISAATEQQTASMEEITATTHILEEMAENLKVNLTEYSKT